MEYKYHSNIIQIIARERKSEPKGWGIRILINGSPAPLSLYQTATPVAVHDTEEDAIAYGKKAAEYIIDHPPAVSGEVTVKRRKKKKQ